MRKLVVLISSVLLLGSCNAQSDKSETKTKDKVEPKIDYKVNKVYDENGNLIRLDSTYTYYYSNIDRDAMVNDSIFKSFNTFFSNSKGFIDDDFFNEFLDRDILEGDDFFKEDFFRVNAKKNQEIMDKMLRRMDSLKNQFFIQEYPLTNKDDAEKHK